MKEGEPCSEKGTGSSKSSLPLLCRLLTYCCLLLGCRVQVAGQPNLLADACQEASIIEALIHIRLGCYYVVPSLMLDLMLPNISKIVHQPCGIWERSRESFPFEAIHKPARLKLHWSTTHHPLYHPPILCKTRPSEWLQQYQRRLVNLYSLPNSLALFFVPFILKCHIQ
jgi:hypothetical protein